MGLLPGVLGLATAAPLIAVLALPSEGLMLLRYRAELNWRAACCLACSSWGDGCSCWAYGVES